jgi:hypothetical protein
MKFIFDNHQYIIRNDTIRGVIYGKHDISILLGADKEESLTFNSPHPEDLVNARDAVIKWSRDWYKN